LTPPTNFHKVSPDSGRRNPANGRTIVIQNNNTESEFIMPRAETHADRSPPDRNTPARAEFRFTGAVLACGLLVHSASAATFEWVSGKVTSITAHALPKYTVAMVDGQLIRFCDPVSGADYAIKTSNVHYDLLKAALLNNRNVKVGVQNFGKSPLTEDEFLGTESVRLCIDRVVLTN